MVAQSFARVAEAAEFVACVVAVEAEDADAVALDAAAVADAAAAAVAVFRAVPSRMTEKLVALGVAVLEVCAVVQT